MEYDISTRSGGHCAPLMHEALGTVEQGAVEIQFLTLQHGGRSGYGYKGDPRTGRRTVKYVICDKAS